MKSKESGASVVAGVGMVGVGMVGVVVGMVGMMGVGGDTMRVGGTILGEGVVGPSRWVGGGGTDPTVGAGDSGASSGESVVEPGA